MSKKQDPPTDIKERTWKDLKNEENFKFLLKELTKKKWKQGQKALCRGGKYCIMGLMCELYMQKNEGRLKKEVDKIGETYYKVNGVDSKFYGFPPLEVKDFFGLSTQMSDQLIKLNDEGKTFQEIKEWLIVSSKISQSE